jgi:hypothetical protein
MSRLPRVARHPRRAALAMVTAAIVVAPLSITATTAAWTDEEWVHGESIGTLELDCGTTTGFRSAATGDFLSGALLGTNLDAVAALAPQALGLNASGTLAVSPAGSLNQGSVPPTYTYTNPLQLGLLTGIAGLDLTGFGTGLPVGSAGAVNQYAQVSGTGRAAGAAGLVSDTGGVLVSEYAEDDDLPEPATISLASLLPSVTGVLADPRVEVGAVGSSAVLDGCAALRSQVWGDGSETGITRDYAIAGLDATLDSAAVAGLVPAVNAAVANLNTAINGLLGPNGALAQLVAARLQVALGSLPVASAGVTGTVTLSGLDLAGAVGPLLTTPLDDGVVSIDLASGAIDLDLAALVGGTNGLNELPANTELVLNAAVVDELVERAGDLLDTRTQQITAAIRAAVRAATLTIDLRIGLTVIGITIGSVAVTATAPLSAFEGRTATITTALTLLPGLPLAVRVILDPVVGLLNAAVTGLGANLVTPVSTLLTATVFSLVDTLGSTLAAVVTSVVDALAVVLAPLPSVLSVAVNVQPDQPGAPPGTTFIPATDDATAQYSVSALRLGVGDGLGGLAHVEFARASAGPVGAP